MMVKTITVAELKKKLERWDDNAIITVDNCLFFVSLINIFIEVWEILYLKIQSKNKFL